MIKWRFTGGNAALQTVTGRKVNDRIEAASEGYALYGPYLELPAGRCTASLLLDEAARGRGTIDLTADKGQQVLASRDVDLDREGARIELSAELAETMRDCEVRLRCDEGSQVAIAALEIDLEPVVSPEPIDPDRPVGHESRKTYAEKLANGFIAKYLSGPAVLEVGYKGYYGATVPIVPQAIGVDIGYPGYDGVTLPFADASFDAIYSSHCFEHIADYKAVLRDWYRLLKVGGYLIIVVPHQYMFEKRRRPPSPANPDHKRFYTVESLAREIAEAFEENSYRIRHITENDRGFNYDGLPSDHSHGCFELEFVVEKIVKPFWNLDDGTVRAYSAGEFRTDLTRPDPWTIPISGERALGTIVWGPYILLGKGVYEVDFYFDTQALGDTLTSQITLDVARNMDRIEAITLSGRDGRERLRDGRVTLRFDNDDPEAFFEFRIFGDGAPLEGELWFKGVNVRYA